jgi:hypothetical protein
MPPEFVVSGSPVTDIGVLTADWLNVPAGFALQGPASGPDAPPTFRALSGSTPMIGRVTGSFQVNSNLGVTGIPCTWGPGTTSVQVDNPADIVHFQPGALLLTATMVEIGFVASVDQTIVGGHCHVILYADPVNAGPGNVIVQPLSYEWVEQTRDLITGALTDKPGGIVGTLLANCLLNLEVSYVNLNNTFVFVYPAGVFAGITCYQFAKYANDQLGQGSLNIGPVNLAPPPTAPPLPPTDPGDVYYDPVTNQYIFNFSFGVQLAIGGSSPVLTGNVTGTSTSAGLLLFTAGGIALTGCVSCYALTSTNVRLILDGMDANGNPYFMSTAVAMAGPLTVDLNAIFAGPTRSPLVSLTCTIEDASGGSHGDYRVAWIIIQQ